MLLEMANRSAYCNTAGLVRTGHNGSFLAATTVSNKKSAFRTDTDCVTAVRAMNEVIANKVIAKYNGESSQTH